MEEKLIDIPIEAEQTPKNKWLYTNDNFGKLERDVVYESDTYQSGIRVNENEIENLTILKGKQDKC